jgi:hypothetical protein
MAEPSKFVWEQDRQLTEEEQARLDERRKKSGASQALGAAMVALGEILDPSKAHTVAVAEVSDDDGDDLPVDLDFGKLPPLT